MTEEVKDRAVVSINDKDTLHKGTHSKAKIRKSCLIIYTGGTIGMTSGADGIKRPNPGQLQKVLAALPEVQHPDVPQVCWFPRFLLLALLRGAALLCVPWFLEIAARD